MSYINGSPLASSGAAPSFEYERPQNEAFAQNAQAARGDGYRSTPITLPIERPPGYGPGAFGGGYGTSSGSADSSFLGAILNSISTLMQQLASFLGSAGGSAVSTPAQAVAPQTAFASATASSTGDPHEALDGTTAQGAHVDTKWDSMSGHGDLLDSDSFRGGYRVSTSVTAPQSNGVTYNANASVTTHGGDDVVTLDKDGSYSVTDHGRSVALTQGQATNLGRNETVTLNADKSLTIVDTNERGGSLTTSLSENGHGVDVKTSATNVDLGGYLVDRVDRGASSVTAAPPVPADLTRYDEFLEELQTPSYGNATEPPGAGELEFA